MEKWIKQSYCFSLCSFFALLTLLGTTINIAKAEISELTKEILPKSRYIETRTINASLQNTSKAFESCWKYNSLFPYVDKSIRLTRTSCYLENDTNGIKNWIQVNLDKKEYPENKVIIIHAIMEKGSVSKFYSEAILISVDENKTKVIFGIDASASGIPQFIMDGLIKSVIKKTVDNLESKFAIIPLGQVQPN